MYDIIVGILGNGQIAEAVDMQQIVVGICGAMVCLLTVLFVDFIKDIFSGFFRG